MAIGNHTYWLVVYLPDAKAVTAPNDWRRALTFVSEEAAQAYADKNEMGDKNFWIVVEVPA